MLLQEMYDKAKVSCYIYKSSQFIKYANDYIGAKSSVETIEESENREKYVAEQEMKYGYENSLLVQSRRIGLPQTFPRVI